MNTRVVSATFSELETRNWGKTIVETEEGFTLKIVNLRRITL